MEWQWHRTIRIYGWKRSKVPNALAWARGQNEVSLSELESHPLFEPIHERALEILTSDDRIAYPSLMGGEIYNFWRDAEHVRGIWRKASLEGYREDDMTIVTTTRREQS